MTGNPWGPGRPLMRRFQRMNSLTSRYPTRRNTLPSIDGMRKLLSDISSEWGRHGFVKQSIKPGGMYLSEAAGHTTFVQRPVS